jgi:hypothetical protein
MLSTYRRTKPAMLFGGVLTRSTQVRTIKDVDVSKLKIEHFDGKHLF